MGMAVSERVMNWAGRRPRTAIVAAVLILTALMSLYGASRPARHDRDWVEHLSRLPHVSETAGGGVTVTPLRDWSYDAAGPVQRIWQEEGASFNVSEVENVWFMVEPHPGLDVMAHTLVLFEFPDDQLVGLTIEARREADEGFSPFWGNWGQYELLYAWASARDLLTRRAVFLDHATYIYPMDLSHAQKTEFVRRLLARTAAIERAPRHYNTLFSNCTNELGKTAGLSWHHAFVLTGYAAQHLHARGLVPNHEPFDVVRENADMSSTLKLLNLAPPSEFDAALLDALRNRFPEQK